MAEDASGSAAADEQPHTLLTLTADIVAAHIGNNSVAVSDMPALVTLVHSALAGLGQKYASEPDAAPLTPAVSVRASVKRNAITCLDCGTSLKMLKRHLHTCHQITPDEYRTRWKLPATYPMVTSDYSKIRRDLSMKIGLGRKPAKAP
jgi:predicted transcriptional regulator